jgi:two-component system sensor histidine kinase KdpD
MSNFLDLIQKSRKGKFKVYIGAECRWENLQDVTGSTYVVEKWYRCKEGYRNAQSKETHELLEGLPVIPKANSL